MGGGRAKRKNNSPLQKDGSKSRRTVEEDVDDMEGDGGSQGGQDDVIADLKEFIRNENASSSKKTGRRNPAVQRREDERYRKFIEFCTGHE